jgi:hypothetical protein
MNEEIKYDRPHPSFGNKWENSLSPEQIRQVVFDWAAWFEVLNQEIRSRAHPVKNRSKLASDTKKRMVCDGPFAETKEAIGGYSHVQQTTSLKGDGQARPAKP